MTLKVILGHQLKRLTFTGLFVFVGCFSLNIELWKMGCLLIFYMIEGSSGYIMGSTDELRKNRKWLKDFKEVLNEEGETSISN